MWIDAALRWRDNSNMKTTLIKASLAAAALLSTLNPHFSTCFAQGYTSTGAGMWTHWTASTGTSATGVLGSSSVTLVTDILNSYWGTSVLGAVTNGAMAGYSSNCFTPNIAATDYVGFASASSFTLTFQPPVTDPTLQIDALANNTLSFSDGTNPIVFRLVNSDGTFTIPTGSTSSSLTGTQSTLDSRGSLLFTGTFSRISWRSDAAITYDGVGLQLSLPLPVLSIQPTTTGVVLLWPASSTIFRLLQNTNPMVTNWVANTNSISVVNGTNQVTISPAVGNMFFELVNP